MKSTTARRLLYAILAASLLLSVAFAFLIPFDHNPDETAHRDYIRLIVENRGFVRFIPHSDLPPGAPTRDEAHQPPLYYLLCAPVYAATGGNTAALRLVAALLQLATIALAYKACRDLFEDRPEIAVGAASVVAFLPTQAQLAGAINNDGLTTLICTAIFWRLGLLITRGQTRRDMAVLGALFGVGLLTKLSVLQLLPSILVAYFVASRLKKMTLAEAAMQCAGALLLGVAIASPWLIRNTLLYGDPLTLKIYRLTGTNYTPDQIEQGWGWTHATYLRNVGVRSFATFFYFLDPNLPPNHFVGSPILLLTVVVLAMTSLLALYKSHKEGRLTGDAAAITLVFVLAVLLLVPFFTRFVLTVFQAQGRYFLPVLLPVAVVTAVAFAGSKGDRRPSLLGVLWQPAVLLAIALCQMMGNGYAPR